MPYNKKKPKKEYTAMAPTIEDTGSLPPEEAPETLDEPEPLPDEAEPKSPVPERYEPGQCYRHKTHDKLYYLIIRETHDGLHYTFASAPDAFVTRTWEELSASAVFSVLAELPDWEWQMNMKETWKL